MSWEESEAHNQKVIEILSFLGVLALEALIIVPILL